MITALDSWWKCIDFLLLCVLAFLCLLKKQIDLMDWHYCTILQYLNCTVIVIASYNQYIDTMYTNDTIITYAYVYEH